MRDESANHEDDVEMLQNDINVLQEELRQSVSQYESELALKNQQLEALDKYLQETKDTISSINQTHQQQIEQLQDNFNIERRETTDKLEQLTQKNNTKDRQITTLENYKESLTLSMQQKDKTIETMRNEFQNEKRDLLEKHDKLKKRLELKEDELTQKKIENEREHALQNQKIVFTE